MSKQTPKVFKSYSSRNGHVFFSRPIIPLCNLFRKFAILYALLTAVAVFCGGQDAVGSQGACADLSFCLDSRPPAEHLEIGGAVPVVNSVPECCAVLVSCFHVAAQNVVVVGNLRLAVGRGGGGICTCAVCAAGPACVEAAGWLVLICEEGLVPPINTNSSDIVLAKFRQQTKWGQQGKKKVGSLLRDSATGKSSALRRSSRNQAKSWRTRCLLRLPSCAFLAGIFPMLAGWRR